MLLQSKFLTSCWTRLAGALLVGACFQAHGQADVIDPAADRILMSPDYADQAVLLDGAGKQVHSWKGRHRNAGGARLQSDGSLLRVTDMPLEPTFKKGGVRGGGLEILERDGTVRWQFWNAVTEHMTYGDALLLPNGNILTAVLEWKSFEDAALAGRDDALLDVRGFFVPGLMEIKPAGKKTGIPVWRWSLWNHLYQQKQPALRGYHFPAAKPGCVDIGSLPKSIGPRWLTPHEIDYCPSLDLIVVTIRELGEAWVIDHSTSEKEAAGEDGGHQGKGGRLLQRLGVEAGAPGFRVNSANWQTDGTMVMRCYNGAVLHATPEDQTAHVSWSIKNARGMKLLDASGKPFTMASAARLANGDHVASNGLYGVISRLSPEGVLRWSKRNELGLRTFRTNTKPRQDDACCGGEAKKEIQAAADNKPVKSPAGISTKFAPVSRLRHYLGNYLEIAHP